MTNGGALSGSPPLRVFNREGVIQNEDAVKARSSAKRTDVYVASPVGPVPGENCTGQVLRN
jgi:hypothetical protein